MTTLDDLKRAIEAVPQRPLLLTNEELNVSEPYRSIRILTHRERYIEHHRLRAEAWRTAFRWRKGLDERVFALMADGWKVDDAHSVERQEGLRLIADMI